jgi:hypothetical protein
MRTKLLKAIVVLGLAVLLACGTAYALQIQIGNVEVKATATFLPHSLPANRNAPVSVESKTLVHTTDGSTPPTLRKLLFVFDKNGAIDTTGLPVCTLAKLAETTPEAAKARCPGAIVGEGLGRATVNFPGQAPIEISSPITLFNAPPSDGRPSLIAHAYEKVPAPKALLVPFVVERIHKGRYGFQVQIQMPEIAGGYGSATLAKAKIDRTWTRGGKTHSYASAHCVGSRLQVHGSIDFADGSFFQGTLAPSCSVRG